MNELITQDTSTVTYQYDDCGNLISSSDQPGLVTEYDALERPYKITINGGSPIYTYYDAAGRVVGQSGGGTGTVLYAYDAFGRLTSVTNQLDQVTRYAYDQEGNQTNQVDALGRVTSYEYDAENRRTKRILPGGQAETYHYNLAGLMDYKVNFDGKTNHFAYDSAGRLTNKWSGTESISFGYNAGGQRSWMLDRSGSTTYAYDPNGRMTQKAGPAGTLNYAYRANGSLAQISSGSGNTLLQYGYDSFNRLASVTNAALVGGVVVTRYGYDTPGNLASVVLPNGVTNYYSYNGQNQLTNLVAAKVSGAVASYAYTLAANGRRQSVAELSGRLVNYAYDAVGRLTNETVTGVASSGSVGYVLDAVGNRLQRISSLNGVSDSTDTFNQNDWLDNNGADSYDANGNTTTLGDVYDFENRLITAVRNGADISIQYDGDGNRVSKTVDGMTTWYLVDELNPTGYSQVMEESVVTNSQMVTLIAYAYGLDLISQHFPLSTINSQLSTSYYGYDGHGSVRYLMDTQGILTDTYDYDAFGIPVQVTGTTPNCYFYSGEQFDHDLGMYFLRARYLNQEKGRFWTLDSFEGDNQEPMSLHKYLYANANPVMMVDPLGKQGLIDQITTMATKSIVWAMGATRGAIVFRRVTATINILAFLNDPGAYVSALESPNAAMNVLAVDLAFLYRTGQGLAGWVRAAEMFSKGRKAVVELSGEIVTMRGVSGSASEVDPKNWTTG